MKPKDIKSLIDVIQSAAADYSCDYDDRNFEITLAVHVEDGWVRVEEQQ